MASPGLPLQKKFPTIVGLIRSHDWAFTPLGEPRTWPSRLQHLIEVMLNSPLASFVICGSDRIFIYNEPFGKLAGGSHPAAFGRPISEGVPDLWAVLKPHYDAVLQGEPIEITSVEWQASSPPSQEGAASVVLTPVRNGHSAVTWVYGQITFSKAALETPRAGPSDSSVGGMPGDDRVRFNDDRLDQALEVARLAIWDWDMQTGKIDWSDENFRIGGYSVGDVEPSDDAWMALIHPDDRAGTVAALTAARESHCPYEHELRLRLPDGTVRWCAALGGFLYDEQGTPVRMIGVVQDVTERRQLANSQQVVIMELQHRTRNLIGLISTLTRKTIAGSASLQDFHDRFERRLGALARVQDLLSRDHHGQHFTFDYLVRTELAAHGATEGEHVTLEGPAGVLLPSKSVHTFALAIHELATNASKYGALKGEGHLLVRWSLRNDAGDREPMLNLEWMETGVEMPTPNATSDLGGYGREMIERALPYQLNAKTRFEMRADGVRCTIALPVSAVNGPAYV